MVDQPIDGTQDPLEAGGMTPSPDPERSEIRRFRAAVGAIRQIGALHASLDDIPPAAPCYACGETTVKAVVTYEYRYQCNQETSVTITKALPGYCCLACGIEYLDSDLDHRFLAAVADAIAGLGDRQLQKALRHQTQDPRSFAAVSPMPGATDKLQ